MTKPLVDALRRAGRRDEAAEIVLRALRVSPDDASLRRLRSSFENQRSRDAGDGRRIEGRVKRLLEPMGQPRFGFLIPDDGGQDIYFSERRIGSDLFSQLEPEQRVAAIIFETDRGFEARSIYIEERGNRRTLRKWPSVDAET